MITKKKIRYLTAFLIVCIVIAYSCKKSVFNDISLQDPSVLIVKVKIHEKTKNNRWLQVTVKDKNKKSVEFSDGMVLVNGEIANYERKKVISRQLGYNYEIKEDEQAFDVEIFWNAIDSYLFTIDAEAGFPGFDEGPTDIFTNDSKEFTIYDTPFYNGTIEVRYKVWD